MDQLKKHFSYKKIRKTVIISADNFFLPEPKRLRITKNILVETATIFFATIFAFSLAVTIGVIWEIIEFATDAWFGTNMQRFDNSVTRDPLMGQNALMDTMKDLILDFIGALIICIVGFIGMKTKTNVFHKWQIEKRNKNKEVEE